MKAYEKACSPEIPYFDGRKAEYDTDALQNIGSLIYRTQENDNLAMDYYMAAYTIDRSNLSAAWNFGITGIRRYCDGEDIDLKKMWNFYTNRFQRFGLHALKEYEYWDGSSYHLDSSLVLLRDQGIGDAFMFSRYIPYVEKYFKKVYVQAEPSMEMFYENPYRDHVDYSFAMCDLGRLLDYIPSGEWLKDKYIAKTSGEFAIGCVWASNSSFENKHYRNCPASLFDTIDCKKYTFGPNASRDGFEHLSGVSWEDTLRNLELVDLVITVDTAMAHFCGSLGKPCLVLMNLHYSDFRWGSKKSGEGNAWYPSVRVIRNNGDWDAVFKRVKEIISGYTSSRYNRDDGGLQSSIEVCGA